jgi:hypothetical protein
MVFNATFNNISQIQLITYMVAVSFIGGENHLPVVSHSQTIGMR